MVRARALILLEAALSSRGKRASESQGDNWNRYEDGVMVVGRIGRSRNESVPLTERHGTDTIEGR